MRNGILFAGLIVLQSFFAIAPAAAQNKTPDLIKNLNSSLIIDSVSIDMAAQKVWLSWTLTTTEPTGVIEVHRQREDGNFNAIFQSTSLVQDTYLDLSSNPLLNSFFYFLVARLPDGNAFATSLAHRPLFLRTPIADPCAKTISLSWNPYAIITSSGAPQPQPTPFHIQNLYVSHNNQPAVLVSEIQKDTDTFLYQVQQSGDYCFYVRAVDTIQHVSSTSNRNCISIVIPQSPQFGYLASVNVEEDHRMQIKFLADNSVPKPTYILKRGAEPNQITSTVSMLESNFQEFVIEDNQADPRAQPWYYSMEVLDSCGNQAFLSNVMESLFLQGQAQGNTINYLYWNAAPSWSEGVERYELYARRGNETSFSLISTHTSGAQSYEDVFFGGDLAAFHATEYRLAAEQEYGNAFGYKEKVFSNRVLIPRTIQVFIPSAFNPSSPIAENRVFKPVFSYEEVANYQMLIFSRWGQRVFETDKLHQGWDGLFQGSPAPIGGYSYVIRFKNENGELQEKTGMLMLLR